MAKITSWFNCDLQKAVHVQTLGGNVFSLDNLGSRISVRIFDGEEKATGISQGKREKEPR